MHTVQCTRPFQAWSKPWPLLAKADVAEVPPHPLLCSKGTASQTHAESMPCTVVPAHHGHPHRGLPGQGAHEQEARAIEEGHGVRDLEGRQHVGVDDVIRIVDLHGYGCGKQRFRKVIVNALARTINTVFVQNGARERTVWLRCTVKEARQRHNMGCFIMQCPTSALSYRSLKRSSSLRSFCAIECGGVLMSCRQSRTHEKRGQAENMDKQGRVCITSKFGAMHAASCSSRGIACYVSARYA